MLDQDINSNTLLADKGDIDQRAAHSGDLKNEQSDHQKAVSTTDYSSGNQHKTPDTSCNAALPKPSLHHPDKYSDGYVALEPDGYYQQTLDVDFQTSEAESAFGMSIQSSTMSTRSSLLESVEENGRTYHKYKGGKIQHHLFKLTLDGKLNLAPVSNPRVVIDIGTGTGTWAIEYALQNPSTKVIGTDLSAIQPHVVPPNCQFEVNDAEDEWVYSYKFDYIHGRAIFSGPKDPAAMFKKAYDALAPGGWFEMQEIYFKPHSEDGTHEGTALQSWNNTLIEGAKKIGRDWWCARNYEKWFREAGFEGVIERRYKWPGNTWPKGQKNKTLGLWTLTNGLDGLSAVSIAMMTRVLGMSPEAVEAVLVDVRRNMKDKSIHVYYPIIVVYGRKPSET